MLWLVDHNLPYICKLFNKIHVMLDVGICTIDVSHGLPLLVALTLVIGQLFFSLSCLMAWGYNCLNGLACCQSEMEVADDTCFLNQSRYADTMYQAKQS